MRGSMRRFAAGILGGMLAGLLTVPMIANAQEQTAEDVKMEFEGWWFRAREPLAPVPPADQINPALPRDASEIPRATLRNQTNVYNGEFLRVGINAGEPEAMTAVSLPLLELGGGLEAIITGGTITFVLAPSRSPAPGTPPNSGANGIRNVEGAQMVGCLVTALFNPDLGGNWEDQPPYDPAVCSPLVRQAGVEPATWVLDLAPFTGVWADPLKNFGVAIVPDPAAEPDSHVSWHVAFDNKFNDREGATPPVADLRYLEQEFEDPFDDLGDDAFGDPFLPSDGGMDQTGQSDGFGGGGFGGGGGFDTGGTSGGFGTGGSGTAFTPGTADVGGFDAPAAAEGVEDPQVAADSETFADQPAAAPFTPQSTDIRTNPAVFLLPFLAMGLVALLGYSLSQDPVLPPEREGAVSKLVRRRATPAAS